MHSRNAPLGSLYGFVNRRSGFQLPPPAPRGQNNSGFGLSRKRAKGTLAERLAQRCVPTPARRRLISRLARQVARQVAAGVNIESALAPADAALAVRS
jgi:hypothetical protein